MDILRSALQNGPMNPVIHLAVLLGLTTSSVAAHAGQREIRKCDFEVKARCVSGDASVTLTDGAATRIAVNVDWCGQGGLGYSCVIDSSRGDAESIWSQDGGATRVANASPWDPHRPDRMKVTVGRHVSIDFNEAQSLGRCGAGAELPRAIVIPAQKGACRVWLSAP
jgi:hypothetical protein